MIHLPGQLGQAQNQATRKPQDLTNCGGSTQEQEALHDIGSVMQHQNQGREAPICE